MNLVRTPCPDRDLLQRFLLGLGTTADAESLEDHLAHCPDCAAILPDLAAEDDLVVELRQRPVLEESGELIERLIRMVPAERVRSLERHGFLDAPAEEGELGRLAHYRILQELGRGGMGVVYLADDTRLKRQVAVKVILDTRLFDERYRMRFEREAETLARLRHPGIVQIHEVGTHRDRTFLVLEFVRGGSLAGLLDGRPAGVREAARVMAQLAEAMSHAHALGIVHRDLKPANVLISGPLSSEESSIAKITDFGLAHRPDEQGLTHTGDLLGTPGYMAPEVAGGQKEVGPAADVYSLGAVLYELLTGRPPFRGENALETIEQVRTLEPIPPRRLRPGLPRDLETICLKCLDREPRRRYPSATGLADDLRAFLDGRPIRARPVGWWERSWRWGRRRPATAALIGVCLACVVALLVGGLVYQHDLSRALDHAEAESLRASANAERAEGNYRAAREALRKMILRTTERDYGQLPRLQDLRRKQVEDALAFFDRVAAQTEEDAVVRQDVARACVEAAKLQILLGRYDLAQKPLARADLLSDELLRDAPGDLDLCLLRADCLTTLASTLPGPKEALGPLARAASLLEPRANDPEATEVWDHLASAYISLGAAYEKLRRHPDAIRCLGRAVELTTALLQGRPGEPRHRIKRARAQVNLSHAYQLTGPPARALSHQARAAADFERALAIAPNDRDAIDGLAVMRINWSYQLAAQGKPNEALAHVSRNVTLLETARKREPEDAAFRDRLYRTHGTRATFLEHLQRLPEAIEAWRRMMELSPNVDDGQRDTLALLLVRAGDHRQAAVEADLVAAYLRKSPSASRWQFLAGVYGTAADLAGKDASLSADQRQELVRRYRTASSGAALQATLMRGLDLLKGKVPRKKS